MFSWFYVYEKEVSILRGKTGFFSNKALIQIQCVTPPGLAWDSDFRLEVKNYDIVEKIKAFIDQRIKLEKRWAQENLKFQQEQERKKQEEEKEEAELERLRKYRHASGDFSDVTPRGFEKIIEELFTEMGYSVTHVGGSGDQGVDLVRNALNKEEMVIVQCKRHKKEIGEPILRDFYGAFIHCGAKAGYIITTSHFTKQAIQWAGNKPIKLINKIQLQKLLMKYYHLN